MNKSGTRTSFVLSGNCADSLLSTAVGTFEGRGGHGLLDRLVGGEVGQPGGSNVSDAASPLKEGRERVCPCRYP